MAALNPPTAAGAPPIYLPYRPGRHFGQGILLWGISCCKLAFDFRQLLPIVAFHALLKRLVFASIVHSYTNSPFSSPAFLSQFHLFFILPTCIHRQLSSLSDLSNFSFIGRLHHRPSRDNQMLFHVCDGMMAELLL